MRFKSVVALLLVVVALGSTASAQAAPFTPGLERAYRVANIYWGGPAPGCSSVDREIVADDSLGGSEIAGEATEPDEGEYIPCELYITRWLAGPSHWGNACRVMIHEVGHLHGLPHNDIPGDIMDPETEKMPAICLRYWR